MFVPGIKLPARRFAQHRRRRLYLFGIQCVCFFISVWSASASSDQSTTTPPPHQHRKHTWPQGLIPTTDIDDQVEEDDDLSANGQHKLRKHRSPIFDENAHRSLRRKEVPVNYRLYDDLLRNYNKAARPVRHPSQVINVTMSAFLYQIFKLVSAFHF